MAPGFDFFGRWACQKMIEASETNIWDGHWACAVLALTRLWEERLVPNEMEQTIRRHLDRTIEEHANAEIYRSDRAYGDFRPGLVQLLVRQGDAIHALGHDVIYANYMLHLLANSDIPASSDLFHAMTRLMAGFAASGPGYVTVNGENRVIHPDCIAKTTQRIPLTASAVLDLFHGFSRPLQMEKGDMQLGHILTHGHAITALKRAERGFGFNKLEESYFTRLDLLHEANRLETITDSTNDDPAFSEAARNPWERSYWDQALSDSRHGHYYKYAYSYLKLNRLAERHPADFRSFGRILS